MDDARDLFSDALEGSLDETARRAFDEALEDDEALREEWEIFRATFQAVGSATLDDEDDDFDEAAFDLDDDALAKLAEEDGDDVPPPPDLLRGVQARIRARSRGRYYRDRFAERSKLGWTPLLLAAVMLVVLAAAWLGMTYVQVAQ